MTLAELVFKPEMSWGLRSAISLRQGGDIPIVPAVVLEEARRFVDEDGVPKPLEIQDIAKWLTGIAGGVNDAPSEEAVMARAVNVMLACQDSSYDQPDAEGGIDGYAFSDDTLVVAIRHFDRWPTASAVYQFVKTINGQRREMMRAMREIVNERPVAQAPRGAVVRFRGASS